MLVILAYAFTPGLTCSKKGDNIEMSTPNQCNNKENLGIGRDEIRNYFISSGHKSGRVTHRYISRRERRGKKSSKARKGRYAGAQDFFFFFLQAGKPKDVRRGSTPVIMRIDCTSGGRGGSGARDSAAWLDLLSSAP